MISGVEFAFGCSLIGTMDIMSKDVLMQMKVAITRLKELNKFIREIAKTLGVAKLTLWCILKK